jgi:hypothetical protein
MSNAYTVVGAASRLADLPERIRDRKIEDEDRQIALQDRSRRVAREDELMGQQRTRFDREQEEWRLSDVDRMQRDAEHIEDRAHDRKLRLRDETEHDQDRVHDVAARDLSLSEARKQAKRGDYLWARSQEDAAKKMREEGLHDLLTALERGADPAQAEQAFNSSGELKIVPGSLRYDPESRRLQFRGPQGNQFDGSIDQLKAIFVPPAAPIKLGENDRLIDPVTRKEVVPPTKRPGRGDDTTKWNRQTASDKAADVVRQGLGLKYDSALQQWSIPEGMSEKVSYGSSLAGQVTREFGSRISAEEAGDIALQVAKSVPTLAEAEQMARQRLAAGGGTPSATDLTQVTNEIMRAARVRAAQKLEQLMQDKEIELEQREQQEEEGGEASARPQKPAGERPPLSSFNGRPAQ